MGMMKPFRNKLASPHLPRTLVDFLRTLEYYADADGVCTMSHEWMAETMGISVRHILRCIRAAKELNLIQVMPSENSTAYSLTFEARSLLGSIHRIMVAKTDRQPKG